MQKNKNFFQQSWVKLAGALGVLAVVVVAVTSSSGSLFKGYAILTDTPLRNAPVSPACQSITIEGPHSETAAIKSFAAKVYYTNQNNYVTGLKWAVVSGAGTFSVTDQELNSGDYFHTDFTPTQDSIIKAYVTTVGRGAINSTACQAGQTVAVRVPQTNVPPTTGSAPTLLSPANGTTYSGYNPDVTFTWSPVSGAKSYDLMLQLGGSTDFSVYSIKPAANAMTYMPAPATSFTYPSTRFPALTQNYTHTWKVRSYDANGGTHDSDTWTFQVTKPNSNPYPNPQVTLTAPTVTAPTEGQVLTNYPRYATIQWSGVNGASQYQLEVACDVCTSTSTYWLNPSTYQTSSTYYTTPALAGDNMFRTHVRAFDANGNAGPWSDYRYFKYSTPAVNPPTSSNMQVYGTSSTSDSVTLSVSNMNLSSPQLYFATCYVANNEGDFKVAYIAQPNGSAQQPVSITVSSLKPATNYVCQAAVATPASQAGSYSMSLNSANVSTSTKAAIITDPYGGQNSCQYFGDVSANNPYYNAINYVKNKGIFTGYPDCTFRPFNAVNRAEAMKVLLLGFNKSVMSGLTSYFTDVYAGQWFFDFVLSAQKYGFVQGYPNGTFRPGNTLNRAEMLKIFLNASQYVSEVNSVQVQAGVCPDVTNSGEWYLRYFQVARNHGLIDSGYCNPGANATRGAMADMFYRLK